MVNPCSVIGTDIEHRQYWSPQPRSISSGTGQMWSSLRIEAALRSRSYRCHGRGVTGKWNQRL